MRCAACGAEVPTGARFCPTCGTSQATIGEERRVVTVLFADIVGFTRLAERRDPEHVKHLVDRCFERLARDITAFGGVIDKIIGDAIVALFGAPVAHEDDAERAVRAALRMQDTLSRLEPDLDDIVELRIGVNTGEVLVGSTSAGGDYTAIGDVMNTASRLQTMAEPGQVLVGSSTWAATHDAVSYRPAGLLAARGRDMPVEAWVAGAILRPPGVRTRRASSFIGREDEMAVLLATAKLALDHSRAQLAVVVGEPGMGKSRLAQEIATEVARSTEARILEGRAVPYGEANVWWPVAELLRDILGLSADAAEPEAGRIVREALADLLAPGQRPHLERYAIGLLHTLGYQTPLRGGDRHRNRSEVTLAVTVALEAQVRRRPLVVLLSDVHWAPEAVWVLVDHILDELARQKLFVIVTARDLEAIEVPVGRHGLMVLQLDRLDDRASQQLLRSAGVDLPPAAAEELIRRSGGNPFFLEELTALVVDRSEPERELLLSQLVEGRLGTLPDTLRGLVSARLDSLPGEERALLDDAAVLGRTGPIAGLQTMAASRRNRTSIVVELSALAAKDLLLLDGNRYEFRSDLVRDVTYATLTKTDRALRHHEIAKYLVEHAEPTDQMRNSAVARIAEHFRLAAELVRELRYVPTIDPFQVQQQALFWIEEAAQRASAAAAPRDAERWYAAGADLADSDERRAVFLLGRARIRCATHDLTGSRADLDRIAALDHRDDVLEARALLVAGDLDRKSGKLSRAVSRLQEAANRLHELGEEADRANALRLLGMAQLFRGYDREAREAIEASRAVAALIGDRRAEAWALQSLAWHAFRGGQLTPAQAYLDEASVIFTDLDDRAGLAWVQGLRAWVAFHVGQWDEAHRLINVVLPESRRRGDPWAESIMLILLASLELWSGRAGSAIEVGRSAIEVAEKIQSTSLTAQARGTTGRALLAVGRIAEGVTLLDDAFVLAERAGDRESQRIGCVANVASAARLGEPERAIRWAARFDGHHTDFDVVGETDVVASLGLALLQRGAVAEASAELAPLLEMADDDGGPPPFALAVGAILAAAEGCAELAEARLAAVLEGCSTYSDRVMARLAVAAALGQRGDLAGRNAALADARAEVESTDDRVMALVVDLAAATMGVGSLEDAESNLRALGLDPAAWRRAWGLAASAGPVGV